MAASVVFITGPIGPAACAAQGPAIRRWEMIQPPEITKVETPRVACDGSGEIRAGDGFAAAALGHPRVFLEIDEHGYVDCGYCDRRFVLKGGPADNAKLARKRDISAGASP